MDSPEEDGPGLVVEADHDGRLREVGQVSVGRLAPLVSHVRQRPAGQQSVREAFTLETNEKNNNKNHPLRLEMPGTL